MGLQSVLDKIVRVGDLTLKLPRGREIRLGDGTGPKLVARITTALWAARIAASPGLAVGEAYMEGGLIVEEGEIGQFIDLVGASAKFRIRKNNSKARRFIRRTFRETNARFAARKNVAHHYDLSDELYRRFLDEDMQYSCGYFPRPGMTLEEGQLAKKRHIAAKLALEPGQKVLDIGCGWGGMAMTLAEECGVEVDGITLSTEQLALASRRAEARGLTGRVNFSLTDYRDAKGPYDRIVSVGMFEHVGRPNYQTYFDAIARLLSDDGVALMHCIGRPEGPNVTNGWIAKYIFPGGYVPALSEVVPVIERAGLFITDIEILRLHYAETIRHWRQRFAAHRAEIAELYDERFCRMWEFYLGVSEQTFSARGDFVMQVQVSKQPNTLPITRDYMHEAEAALERPSRPVRLVRQAGLPTAGA